MLENLNKDAPNNYIKVTNFGYNSLPTSCYTSKYCILINLHIFINEYIMNNPNLLKFHYNADFYRLRHIDKSYIVLSIKIYNILLPLTNSYPWEILKGYCATAYQ